MGLTTFSSGSGCMATAGRTLASSRWSFLGRLDLGLSWAALREAP